MSEDSPKKRTHKRAWGGRENNRDITRKLADSVTIANHSVGNIGDSIESRNGLFQLGGGSDMGNGQFGYTGQLLDQSIYTGEESTVRGANKTALQGKLGGRSETKLAWSKIAVTRSVYHADGQVSSIIDLMADFCTEGLIFVHKNNSVQKFFRAWAEKVKLRARFRNAVRDLLASGNLFYYRVYALLSSADTTAMKSFTFGQRIGDQILITTGDDEEYLIDPKIQYDSMLRLVIDPDKTKSDDQVTQQIKNMVTAKVKSKGEKIVDSEVIPGEAGVVPWKYISLNPLQMIPGDGGEWIYLLKKEEISQLLEKASIKFNESKKTITVDLPDGIAGRLKPSSHPGFFMEMTLDESRVSVLQYNKFDWEKWGTGLLWKAMSSIIFKNTLRQMEIKTAKAAINTLFVWKLGDHKEGLMPNMDDFERLADMLKAPASTLNVLWNSAVDVDVVQPDIKQIFDEKRWEGLRKEVTSQFGITQQIVTGEGGNFSSSFISVQGLLERLQNIRDMILEDWILPDVLQVTKAMKFRTLPRVLFNQMSLRDKAAENDLLLSLFDRGVVSDETVYEQMNRDVEIERERRLDYDKWLEENDLGRKGPYDTDKDQLDFQRDSKEADDEFREKQFNEQKKQNVEQNKVNLQKAKQPKPAGAPQPKGPGGKPKGKTGPNKKKRESKPKNLARVDVENIVKQFDKEVKSTLVARANVADFRSLSKDDKSSVIEIVGASVNRLLFEDVGNVLGAVAMDDIGLDEEFSHKLNELGMRFKQTFGRKPNKAEVYSLLVDAFMELNGSV